MNNPTKALVQFEATLEKEPRRFRSLYGAAHAAQLSGSSDLSLKYFGELLTICALSDKPGRTEIEDAREALAMHMIRSRNHGGANTRFVSGNPVKAGL
jgi:hypothetical protein